MRVSIFFGHLVYVSLANNILKFVCTYYLSNFYSWTTHLLYVTLHSSNGLLFTPCTFFLQKQHKNLKIALLFYFTLNIFFEDFTVILKKILKLLDTSFKETFLFPTQIWISHTKINNCALVYLFFMLPRERISFFENEIFIHKFSFLERRNFLSLLPELGTAISRRKFLKAKCYQKLWISGDYHLQTLK